MDKRKSESRCSTRKKCSKAVMLNLFQHLVVTKQRTIPECRCRGSKPLNKPVIPEGRNRESRPLNKNVIPEGLYRESQPLSGFTLLEVIVAIIIIGALLAFALPKYETALDKSRFSTLMPLTKSIKDAEEVFYIASNQYTEDVSSLDVKVNPGETVQVSVKDDDDYSYVQAIDPRIENIYKAYLKHSTNFPEERHCEALTDSTRAKKVCETLGGTLLDESGDYTVYVLEGTGNGSVNTEKQCEGTEPETTQTCASGCGTQTRTVSCDTSTGEWDLGDWTGTCPEQGETSQSCTSGVGTETRTFTCEGNTWVVGEWDTSACTCDPDSEPSTEQTCSSGCGTQIRTNSCVNGEWVEGEWQNSCTDKPDTTQSCSDGCRTGTQSRTVTCTDGAWVVGNFSTCSVTKPSNSSSSCAQVSANGYTYSGGTYNTVYTCSNGSWKASYSYYNCTGACSNSTKPSNYEDRADSSCPGGVVTHHYYCRSGTWVDVKDCWD